MVHGSGHPMWYSNLVASGLLGRCSYAKRGISGPPGKRDWKMVDDEFQKKWGRNMFTCAAIRSVGYRLLFLAEMGGLQQSQSIKVV